MVLAPAIAASLNAGLPARSKALWIDGLDVLKNSATSYGVPIESISLTEAAPGQVSSLSFTIEDPTGAIKVTDAAFVRFYDITRDLPLFTGFVASTTPVALGIGRAIEVECVGIEIVLDWWYSPATSLTGMTFAMAVQHIIAGAMRSGSVQVGVGYTGLTASSITSNPPGPVSAGYWGVGSGSTAPAGTVRQALQSVIDTFFANPPFILSWSQPFTIDFRGYLRVADNLTELQPFYVPYYAALGWNVNEYVKTLTLPTSGTPSETEASIDSSGAVRAVYVTGTGAGSGIVTDGTGKPGPVAAVSDSNSTSADARISIGGSYIHRQGVSIAGSVTVEEFLDVGSVGSERRASMLLYLTDPNLGVVANPAAINAIEKTFLPNGKEIWRISFGAVVAASNYVRMLTRSQLV